MTLGRRRATGSMAAGGRSGSRSRSYRDPSGRVIHRDTLRFTHRGPLTRAEGGELALAPLDGAGGRRGARRLCPGGARHDRAGVARLDGGLPRAGAEHARGRSGGTIAIRSTGRFPLRPGGRGDVVQRGDTSASDWVGDWSLRDLPQAIAPSQGYLASANQQPIDPARGPALPRCQLVLALAGPADQRSCCGPTRRSRPTPCAASRPIRAAPPPISSCPPFSPRPRAPPPAIPRGWRPDSWPSGTGATPRTTNARCSTKPPCGSWPIASGMSWSRPGPGGTSPLPDQP